MKIGITSITKKAIDGTDPQVVVFTDFMQNKRPEKITPEYLSTLADGAYKYVQVLLYQGSRGIVENLKGILNAPNETELRTILSQWREMEDMSWEVIDDGNA